MSTLQTTPPAQSAKPSFPRLTANQKQAIMDNLTLEVSERARKLRTQHALIADGLRSRLEMRVNRVPKSIKTTALIDLIDRHSEVPHSMPSSTSRTATAATSKNTEKMNHAVEAKQAATRIRAAKRTSEEMTTSDDKENVDISLSMPKKRSKTAASSSTDENSNSAPIRNARTASRKAVLQPSQVLSPRSTNPVPAPRVASKTSSTSSSQPVARSTRAPAIKKTAAPKAAAPKAENRKTTKKPAGSAATGAPTAPTRSLRSRK